MTTAQRTQTAQPARLCNLCAQHTQHPLRVCVLCGRFGCGLFFGTVLDA
ncbi:TPA: hypothetical protein QDC03_007303 [Burkholderia cepacia]|nr:hypothetical protein [Burkholderia cepacia]